MEQLSVDLRVQRDGIAQSYQARIDERSEEIARLKTELADKIKRTREAAGMTQADVALAFGTKQSRVSEWEDPFYAKYNLLTLAKLADILDCQLSIDLVSKAQKAVKGQLSVLQPSKAKKVGTRTRSAKKSL